jgi:DNA-binding CsgD family transcriptional regulator
MKSRDFRIDESGLMDVLEDEGAAALLLCMQLHGSPLTLKALSQLASQPTEKVAKRIDMLRAVGLASAVRAGGSQRSIRYKAAPSPLRVYFDGTDAAQSRRVAGFSQKLRARLEAKIDAAGITESVGRGAWSSECLYLPLLSPEEMRELRARFGKVFEYLQLLEQRRWSQLVADRRAGRSVVGGLQHSVEVRVRPLRAPVMPELDIEFLTRNSSRPDGRVSRKSATQLTPRESQVARLLAEGWSRPRVAKMLGVTTFTVVALSGRIYRKLGVRSRAQLTLAVMGRPHVPPGQHADAARIVQE